MPQVGVFYLRRAHKRHGVGCSGSGCYVTGVRVLFEPQVLQGFGWVASFWQAAGLQRFHHRCVCQPEDVQEGALFQQGCRGEGFSGRHPYGGAAGGRELLRVPTSGAD